MAEILSVSFFGGTREYMKDGIVFFLKKNKRKPGYLCLKLPTLNANDPVDL
jgi:hypothetical protein